MKPAAKEAYELLHEGTLALAKMEHWGMRVDVAYLDRTMEDTARQIRDLSSKLRSSKFFRQWRKRFGDRANLGSREQLAVLVFQELGYKEVRERTSTGRQKASEDAFDHVNHPFIKEYIRLEKLKKAHGTYLKGIKREVVGDILRSSWDLNTAVSFRSSCSDPNLQNFPKRIPWLHEMIRRCIIPRKGRVLVEVDYSTLEVRISCAYHKDPTLMEYMNDPKKDMHRDTAMELFFLTEDQVDKRTTRDWSKNRFVFPQFYGSVYFQCAPHLWEAVEKVNPEVAGEFTIDKKGRRTPVTLKEHLIKSGCQTLGACQAGKDPAPWTFEYHVRQVERKFWEERFPVYTEWKRSWYQRYLSKGYFRALTGFVFQGEMSRNDTINYPVQGSAFHCLLMAVILTVRWRLKSKMKFYVINEVHDSMLLDVPERELQDVLHNVRRIMEEEVPRLWRWINVPLLVEADVSASNWFEQKPWHLQEGQWISK